MRTVSRWLIAVCLTGALVGCARNGVPADSADLAGAKPPPSGDAAVVPQLADQSAAEADKGLAAAGLVSILRYEPGIVSDQGSVISTDPPAGSRVAAGSTVTVIVAGAPGNTLAAYVDAHREIFVGVGFDSNGVTVVAVYQKADLPKEMTRLTALSGGSSIRVQSCARSWTDLARVELELNQRTFVKGANKLAYGMAIDPLACAVRLTADLNDDEVATLTEKYQGALVIQKGTAKRL